MYSMNFVNPQKDEEGKVILFTDVLYCHSAITNKQLLDLGDLHLGVTS